MTTTSLELCRNWHHWMNERHQARIASQIGLPMKSSCPDFIFYIETRKSSKLEETVDYAATVRWVVKMAWTPPVYHCFPIQAEWITHVSDEEGKPQIIYEWKVREQEEYIIRYPGWFKTTTWVKLKCWNGAMAFLEEAEELIYASIKTMMLKTKHSGWNDAALCPCLWYCHYNSTAIPTWTVNHAQQ